MPSWTVSYAPPLAVLAVLVGRTVTRTAELTLEGTSLDFQGRSLDASDLRLGRWQHPRTGGLGSFVELGPPSAPLRLASNVLIGDDRHSTAPSAKVDGWLTREDFDALVIALEAAGRRARAEPEPSFRPVDRGPRTLVLRPNGWRAGWKVPLLIFAALAVVVALAGLGSLWVGEVALMVGVLAMPVVCWVVAWAAARPPPSSALVVDGFELRIDPGDGSRITLDTRYADVEPRLHEVRGRAHFDFPLIHLRGKLSEQEIAIGTDDLRLGWSPEVTAPAAPHATWLLGPAEWLHLLETLGVGRFVEGSGSW